MEYEKMLLDLMDRVIRLEKEVEELKKNNAEENNIYHSSFSPQSFDNFDYSQEN